MHELLFDPMGTSPLSHGFHLATEKTGTAGSRSSQLAGDWHKRENTEHSDVEEDVRLHELMENIKRYIRNIDVSAL
jgi:hypothetical protein